jgi:hypothetical protein
MNGGWCTKVVERPYGVGVWKLFQRGWEVFSKFISFDVGDGSHIRFWYDNWCRDQPSKKAFSKLFRITSNKEVTDLCNCPMEYTMECSFITSCPRLGGRGGDDFFGKLYAFHSHMGVTDCMRWSPSNKPSLR